MRHTVLADYKFGRAHFNSILYEAFVISFYQNMHVCVCIYMYLFWFCRE